MRHRFYRDTSGIWRTRYSAQSLPEFVQLQLIYLNKLDPFFKLAAEKCELEFILCLLRFVGMKAAGWDPYDTLEETYKIFHKTQSSGKLRDAEKAHYALFTYGLIIEASIPYNLLANLMNVIEGGRYRLENFPDITDAKGRSRPQTVLTKVSKLKSRARSLGLDLDFLDEIVDNKLRNGIFHSDYSIYWPELRINDPVRRYTYSEWTLLVNRSFAYIQAFFDLQKVYRASYSEPGIVEPHPEFNTNGGTITTIVRQGYGVIGIKDTWTAEQIKKGAIPHRLGSFLPYEIALVEKGHLLLPPNRIERFNRGTRIFPGFIRRYLVKKYKKNFGIKD